ncbi:beta-propeller domain-containing protein [Lysobacter sp. Root983]|uniref:beta-propeller domain-containing protein n=1 Tax=Lysobacter sp. Root983 TaxID=1736613 RepID=UPI00070AD930|nr:beta-propeller domain-containing protein [Lysobacter sp. Root983]KRD75905.1 hypothetical protein ASE43_13830 [Lysobacter sp. Root983]
MNRKIVVSIALSAVLLAACAKPATPPVSKPSSTLQSFEDEAAFQRALTNLQQAMKRRRQEAAKEYAMAPPPPPSPPPAPMSFAESSAVDAPAQASADAAAAAPESITNIQTLGVDEGDIVKNAGDYLIVLRRGRLFSIRVGGDGLQPVATIDAYAPGSSPNGTWYDEMLVSGRDVIVIGYSYERGGTEIGLFALGDDGGLRHRDTYQLRSGDYYSQRNYASRLIGRQLIFYAPVPVYLNEPESHLPALRHWRPGAQVADFKRILPASRIYDALDPTSDDYSVVLHTVSVCDLGRAELECRATAVLGDRSREFYVAQDAVYVWISSGTGKAGVPSSSVFRMPLDGGAPSALRTSGSPIDQMSFLQRDGYLNVLVGSDYDGHAMWRDDAKTGELALLRVKLDEFGDASASTRAEHYRPLPALIAGYGAMQNRYVGDWLLVGAAPYQHDDRGAASTVLALRYASQRPVQALSLPHAVSRIEALGRDALLVGSSGNDLHFSGIRLGDNAAHAGRFVYPGVAEGDQRTHGFFYRPTADDAGIAGLPILRADERDYGAPGQASVVYLRNRALHLSRMGQLDARTSPAVDDGCQVSCVDWYGNARPIFVGERVFALLGYELVEGRVDADRIQERRRVDFGPARAAAISK